MEPRALWHVSDLKKFIEASDPSLHPLSLTVDSLARADEIFKFHMRECRDLLLKFDTDAKNLSPLIHVLGGGENRFVAEQEILAAEAHLVAAINTVRSIFDVFSQLVNGLLLSPKLGERDCSVQGVAKALPACELKDQIGVLLDSAWFKYVQAFINMSKHRRLVPRQYHFNVNANKGGIQVLAFEYKGESYDEAWALDVLLGSVDVKNVLPVLGNALNQELKVLSSSSGLPSPRKVTFIFGQ